MLFIFTLLVLLLLLLLLLLVWICVAGKINGYIDCTEDWLSKFLIGYLYIWFIKFLLL